MAQPAMYKIKYPEEPNACRGGLATELIKLKKYQINKKYTYACREGAAFNQLQKRDPNTVYPNACREGLLFFCIEPIRKI